MNDIHPEGKKALINYRPSLMPAAILVFLLSLVFAVFTARSLYQDGAYYFIRVLTDFGFTEIIPYRSYAGYLFDFPAVIALKLGVTDIALLQIAFGIGCFSIWPLAMAFCHWLSPKDSWIVVLACATGYLNAAFIAIGEHIVAHAFFWPVCFVVLFARPLTPLAAAGLLVSSLILLRCYESLLFLGPLLAGLALWRTFTGKDRNWQRVVFMLAAALLCWSAYIAYDGLLHPGKGPRLGSFKTGALNELAFPAWTICWSYLWVVLMIASWSPTVRKFISSRTGLFFLGGIILLWGAWPLLQPARLDPTSQYEARFLNLLVPMLLLPVAFALAYRPEWLATQRRTLVNLSAALLLAQSLWHLSATEQWRSYRHLLQDMLASKTGVIHLRDTPYGNNPAVGRQATRFVWEMDAPVLSIVIGPRKVKSIIQPPNEITGGPCNPFAAQPPLQLERYGIDYGEYFKAAFPSQSANRLPPAKP